MAKNGRNKEKKTWSKHYGTNQPFDSSITINNGWSPPHRYAGPGNAERIEAEERLLLGSPLLFHKLDVVIQHHLRHNEFECDGGEETTRTDITWTELVLWKCRNELKGFGGNMKMCIIVFDATGGDWPDAFTEAPQREFEGCVGVFYMSGISLHVCLARSSHVGGKAEGVKCLRGRIIGRVSHDWARRYANPVTRGNMRSIGAGECVRDKSLSWHGSWGRNEPLSHFWEIGLKVTYSNFLDLDVRILWGSCLVLVACWASYKMYRRQEGPEFDAATIRQSRDVYIDRAVHNSTSNSKCESWGKLNSRKWLTSAVGVLGRQ